MVQRSKAKKLEQKSTIGRHLIIEIGNASRLDEKEYIARVLSEIADTIGATTIRSTMHDFGEGYGVTGLVLLAESHISVHTWPEYKYAAVDVFMCGLGDIYKSITVLRSYFPNADIEHELLIRGVEKR